MQVSLPVPALFRGQKTSCVDVKLTGFKLRAASVVSDYWCQGSSFRDQCWIADMMPAATGIVERASNLVIMSRFADKASFKSLRTLWDSGDILEESRIKRILLNASRMNNDLRADMCRTRIAAWKTQAKFKDLFAQYGLDTDLEMPSDYAYNARALPS